MLSCRHSWPGRAPRGHGGPPSWPRCPCRRASGRRPGRDRARSCGCRHPGAAGVRRARRGRSAAPPSPVTPCSREGAQDAGGDVGEGRDLASSRGGWRGWSGRTSCRPRPRRPRPGPGRARRPRRRARSSGRARSRWSPRRPRAAPRPPVPTGVSRRTLPGREPAQELQGAHDPDEAVAAHARAAPALLKKITPAAAPARHGGVSRAPTTASWPRGSHTTACRSASCVAAQGRRAARPGSPPRAWASPRSPPAWARLRCASPRPRCCRARSKRRVPASRSEGHRRCASSLLADAGLHCSGAEHQSTAVRACRRRGVRHDHVRPGETAHARVTLATRPFDGVVGPRRAVPRLEEPISA